MSWRKNSRKGYMLISGLLLGFGLIVAYRGNLGFQGVFTISQLITMEKDVEALEKEQAILRASLTQINEQLSDYSQNIEEYGSVMKSMELELEKTALYSGQYDVEGEGIIIVLNDSKKELELYDELKWFIIHDIDILELVNELKAAGAEAIEINGTRIGATTNIRCGGPTIIIDGNRNTVPFVIKAIGNAKKLEAAMLAPGSYLDILELNSLEIDIETVESMRINKYENPSFKYLEKIEGGVTQ